MVKSETVPGRVEIRAEDLKVSYRSFVALRIEELQFSGRVIAIIGHNGSGKSTFLKSLLQLLPHHGTLASYWIYGQERSLLVPEQHMAFSPENGAIFEDMPVESYIKLWCRIKKKDGNYYRKQGSYFIERLNLSPLLSKLGRELSKGQRQRIQAAIGFLISPRLFLFDEPFDGLDINQSNELANIMLEESSHLAMIVSSHRMEVIERLADLVVVLHDGKVLTHGSVDQVCAFLCGNSYRVSPQRDEELFFSAILPQLQRKFYHCLINQIGNQVIITGSKVTFEDLEQFFMQNHSFSVKLDLIRPSLIDAMRFSLGKMQ